MPRPKVAQLQQVEIGRGIVLQLDNGQRVFVWPSRQSGVTIEMEAKAPVTADAAMAALRNGLAHKRGRKPSKETIELRELLTAHRDAGTVHDAQYYQDWYAKRKPGTAKSYLSTVVKREAASLFITLPKPSARPGRPRVRRTGRRGPKASEEALLVREKIAADGAKGEVKDRVAYAKWLVDKSTLGLSKAKAIVSRELKRAGVAKRHA